MYTTLIIIIITTITFLIFKYHNNYKKIELYFLNNDKKLFILLEISLLIITLSLIYNIRHFIMIFIKKFTKQAKK
jgi:hypothetical protein